MPERKPSDLHFSCHCEGGTTEAISLKTRGLLRRSFLTPRNDSSHRRGLHCFQEYIVPEQKPY